MPEGHTIHRRARDHARWFAGQTLRVASPQGRFADEAADLDGRRLLRTEAWGKHLFHVYEEDAVVHIHLGLFGRFRMYERPEPEPRGAGRMRLVGEARCLDLVGPTRCVRIDTDEMHQAWRRLGPDPLRDDADPELVWDNLQRRRRAIGAVLLDQSIVAGIGNVFRAELLFLTGLHPETRACDVSRSRFDDLWARTAHLLDLGVRLNRIVTIEPDDAPVPARQLKRGQRVYVYKQKHCRRCGTAIRRWELGSRTVYACERCQPPP